MREELGWKALRSPPRHGVAVCRNGKSKLHTAIEGCKVYDSIFLLELRILGDVMPSNNILAL